MLTFSRAAFFPRMFALSSRPYPARTFCSHRTHPSFYAQMASSSMFFGNGQGSRAALPQTGVVFVRERRFFVIARGALGELIGQRRCQGKKALLTVGMELIHTSSLFSSNPYGEAIESRGHSGG